MDKQCSHSLLFPLPLSSSPHLHPIHTLMDYQEMCRSVSPNSVQMTIDQMDVEANSPCFLSKVTCPSRDEQNLKIRKPYTITKQRERWTVEEHNKFLEALELYGRAWRRIEEHIGTKTAVQIRSHAQKFFTKVARESTSAGVTTAKSIVIPPPRPKRKPLHPYPRKLGNPSIKENPTLEPLKGHFLSTTLISEQDNGSPTSVLSAFGSETMNSLILSRGNNCTSPIVSASGSNGHDNRSRLPPSLADEENTSPFQGPSSGGIGTQDQYALEQDLVHDDGSGSEQGPLLTKPSSTLKLFGKTVMVGNQHKPSITGVELNVLQSSKQPPPSTMMHSHRKNIDTGLNSPIQPPFPNILNKDYFDGSVNRTWSPWTGGVAPLLYCLPLQNDPSDPAESDSVSMPWLSYYGNVMLPSVDIRKQVSCQSRQEALNGKEVQKEGSWTGSNSASFTSRTDDPNGDISDSEKAEDTMTEGTAQLVVLGLNPGGNAAISDNKVNDSECGRGFVPYKRCAFEKQVGEPQASNEEVTVRQ